MSATISANVRFARPAAPPAPSGVLAKLGAMWQARRSRRLLLEMDDRLLADIGLDRGQARTEAGRAPWDLGKRR